MAHLLEDAYPMLNLTNSTVDDLPWRTARACLGGGRQPQKKQTGITMFRFSYVHQKVTVSIYNVIDCQVLTLLFT